MNRSQLTLHYDLWTFSTGASPWDISVLALRTLHKPLARFRVTACRGGQGLQVTLDDADQFKHLVLRYRPTVLLVESAPGPGAESSDLWAMRFTLSPLHSEWIDAGFKAPEPHDAGSDAWRIARSIQATVAWNQPAAFPTMVGGFHKGCCEELGHRLSALLSVESAEHAPMDLLGTADILSEGCLRLGLREFLGEHPLLAPALVIGLDRVHDYVLSLGVRTSGVAEALIASGAERLSTPRGELLRLPEALKSAMKGELIRRGLLPGDRPESVRKSDESLGEFRLPDGRLFLTRRRKRELAKQGYWMAVGPRDETVLMPFERHCAAIGLSEDDGLEIVVQSEHASRLRSLVLSLEEAAGGTDARETVLTVYTRALSSWPFGGFFGRSTGAFLALLRRIVTPS